MDIDKHIYTFHETPASSHEEAQGEHTSLLTAAEQEQLAAWNATQQPFPTDRSLAQLVADQASATPDALALVAGERVLTYLQLNHRANQLAHWLRSQGIGPNTLVGICLPRSLELVIGLLAILKAGGAYVPLDPSAPAERLAFQLEDAQVALLLTHEPLLPKLSPEHTSVVCLDRAAALLTQQSTSNPQVEERPENLAYVIYTSGSTGQPKGALIPHRGLLNLIYWHQRAFGLTAADRATQVASPAFDATGWELWPSLTCGASVYLPDDETRLSPVRLQQWLLHHRISISFQPTALAEQLLALDWPQDTPLRFLLTGADKLQHYPRPGLPFALVNNYGLTEASVVNTSGRILPCSQPSQPPSIGRPIANTHLYLLDEQLRQVPIGQVGELYLGGVGLAQGYLNRPQLTAERFVAHPFSQDPSARLYQTGDLARFLPDGQLHFIGRADQQIKLRGYRIEPSEIVSVLNQHPAIHSSVVVAQEDSQGDKQLVAYLVLHPGTSVMASQLREQLVQHLPDYMVPSTFVQLEALPLTANGKVDRRVLPAPDANNTLQQEPYAAPRTPTEQRVASIVTHLLDLEQVGVQENFFLLGGHSLLGTQLLARIAEDFGVQLTLRTLFEAPTIAELSEQIEQLIFAQVEAMSDDEVQRLLEAGQSL